DRREDHRKRIHQGDEGVDALDATSAAVATDGARLEGPAGGTGCFSRRAGAVFERARATASTPPPGGPARFPSTTLPIRPSLATRAADVAGTAPARPTV